MLNEGAITISQRKLRLFAVACCYRAKSHFHEWCWKLVEGAEMVADDAGDVSALIRDRDEIAIANLNFDGCDAAFFAAGSDPHPDGEGEDPIDVPADYKQLYTALDARYAAEHCACMLANVRRGYGSQPLPTQTREERAVQTQLLRDIAGNPFRPVALDPAWLTPTVVSLAEGIYADRAFDRMPPLADALQAAGCENAAVLDHCRGPGPHVRGCWVVDLVLRKE